MLNNKPDSQNTEPPKVEAKDNSIAVGSIEVHGNVEGGIHIGNTIIQKFFNIFKSDSETLEQRNRRILLNHVENAWIKGVLDASLHGAALLDLGIKQDLEAVTKYPWAIKKESTDETLPTGKSMLEIFDSIGMGRSLLILGAPGSGKTTMLLELARGLIARAREDVTQPIPMVFNLASWTEKLTLADWLAQELNNLYSVPRKTAPDWVKGDKLLLLLDGLDEVRLESRAKCVEAINAFRKEHGLTSLAVCSRSQDYADLKTKISFEGAIEVQPLTQEQIAEFFNRFGDEMAGIKQALEKDSGLREMAETPLFLSIMLMAYRDKKAVEILVSGDKKTRRKHLFDTYIKRMFERHSTKDTFNEKKTLNRLTWLAQNMTKNNQASYFLESMQPNWLSQKKQGFFGLLNGLIFGLFFIIFFGITAFIFAGFSFSFAEKFFGLIFGLIFILFGGLFGWLNIRLVSWLSNGLKNIAKFDWKNRILFGLIDYIIFSVICWFVWSSIDWLVRVDGAHFDPFANLLTGLFLGLFGGTVGVLGVGFSEIKMVDGVIWDWRKGRLGGIIGLLIGWLRFGVLLGLPIGLFGLLVGGFSAKVFSETTYPGQRIYLSLRNFFFVFILTWVIGFLIFGLVSYDSDFGLFVGLFFGVVFGLRFGGLAIIGNYTLRFILARNNLLPWRLIPFLDHCVDLIFLRRVGGGYIFVHRLLMEHFAEMYVETPTSKGN